MSDRSCVPHYTGSPPACSTIGTMLLTTTPTIQGKNIRHYRGIVTGEAIVGANIFDDFFAGI